MFPLPLWRHDDIESINASSPSWDLDLCSKWLKQYFKVYNWIKFDYADNHEWNEMSNTLNQIQAEISLTLGVKIYVIILRVQQI